MKSLCLIALAIVLVFSAAATPATPPEPSYEQTRDWVVAALTEFGGYVHAEGAIVYQEVSMDGCKLQFSTFQSNHDGYADTDTFTVPLDSIKDVLWGTVSSPSRGYVLFTTTTPINFSKRRVWKVIGHATQITNSATNVAAIEFGRPGADYAKLAGELRAAILRAADFCKVQVAAK